MAVFEFEVSALVKRLITAVIGLAVLFSVTLSPSVVLTVAVILVSLLGLFEMLRALGLTKNPALMILGAYFFMLTSAIAYGVLPIDWHGTPALFFLGLLLCFVLCVLKYGKIHFPDVAMLVLSSVMIPLFFSALPYVRSYSDGHYLIYYIFVGAWVPDTLAYFFGRFFGKKKLCPVLSPKKTVAGSIGAVLGGVLGTALLYAVLRIFFHYSEFTLPMALVFGLFSGIISQFGDLTFSAIKRDYQIKDFGTIMPGHGGVLDRFDSLLFIAPSLVVFLWLS